MQCAERNGGMRKSERRRMSKIAEMGCILCSHLGLGDSPAELHHPRTGVGIGRRAPNSDVIPLCPNHHRLGNGSLHVLGRKEFERMYGVTELVLLEMTLERFSEND